MKRLADTLTLCRIAGSIAILLCKLHSGLFRILYVFCGLTDMLDGTVARRTHTESAFGARLDTAADVLFAAVCFVKLLPALRFPLWLWLWAALIAAVKLISWLVHFVRTKQIPAVHSIPNKVTGVMLFLLPFTLRWGDGLYAAIPICMAASFAAVQESILLIQRKEKNHE